MDSTYQKRGYLLEDFRLFHLRDASGIQTDYHYHEFCKLLVLYSGSGGYTVEGHRYLLKPGDLVLLGSHCVHRPEFEPTLPYERVILYISPAFLQRESVGSCQLEQCFSGEQSHVLRLPENRRQRIFSLIAELEQELSGDRFGREIVCNGKLLQLLVEIARSQRQSSAQHPEPIHPTDKTVLAILTHLENHLTEDLSIDQLAEQFYLSKFHMMRRFRQETGTTIHNYISERRLFLARDMLAQGIPSTEVCYRVGFGSYSSFSRAYSKLFGTTPTGRPNSSKKREEPYEE